METFIVPANDFSPSGGRHSDMLILTLSVRVTEAVMADEAAGMETL
jgi:hypothetical protein